MEKQRRGERSPIQESNVLVGVLGEERESDEVGADARRGGCPAENGPEHQRHHERFPKIAAHQPRLHGFEDFERHRQQMLSRTGFRFSR